MPLSSHSFFLQRCHHHLTMANLFDDSFDLSFDDSDLVPLFARQQLASQQSQQQKQKAKDTTIVLDDDDDDDDKEEEDDDKEKKGGTPTKRRSAQPPPKKSPKKRSSSVEVITLLDSDSEKEEMSSSPSKGASNAGKKLPTFSFSSSSSSSSPSPSPEREPPFTALKKVPSAQSSQSSPSSSPRAEAAEEPYWDPFGNDDFDDQFLPPLPRRFLPQSTRSTPSKAKVISSSSTSTISSKGLLIRSTKKVRGSLLSFSKSKILFYLVALGKEADKASKDLFNYHHHHHNSHC